MRSEKEFIDGVYEKYEKQLEIRRRRIKMLSACATLSACACVVLVVAIRIFPAINNVVEDAAVAEASYEYSGYGLYSSSVEPEAEAVFDINESYKSAVKSQSRLDVVADTAESYDEDIDDGAAPTVAEEAVKESAKEPAEAENGVLGAVENTNFGAFEFNLYTSNSQIVYADKTEYANDDGSIIATAHINEAGEGESATPVISEADGGYYVSFYANGEEIVIFLDGEIYEKETVKAVAESLVYNFN